MLASVEEYRFKFIDMNVTIYEACRLFTENQSRIDALILTQTGKRTEKIEAVITYNDILKFMYENKHYIVDSEQ